MKYLKITSLVMIVSLVVIVSSCKNRIAKTTASVNVYSKEYIKTIMQRAFQWQLTHPVEINVNNNDWARAVFYTGIMRAYNFTGNDSYKEAATAFAKRANWQPAQRFRHADDLTRGQVFLDLYMADKTPDKIMPIQLRIDSIMASPKPGREDWWWCDALFMEPPVLARLAQITGDKKYAEYLDTMWWDATEFLFDKTENLYFRDKSFFDKRTASGKKVFWSRGNGWVMAGLVQVLEHLPVTDPSYPRYIALYKKMAAKISTLQQPDGLWRASLLDPMEVPVKETSGSGFYTFALAWGIHHGYLDRPTYLPVVQKGWQALTNAVAADGKLTWVQQIGAKPESVKESDNQEYGTGALLMAGTEMMQL